MKPSIITKDPKDQSLYLNGLSATRGRTNPYFNDQIPKPVGFHNKPCKRCRSLRTIKSGKQTSKYQRCESCAKVLGVPSNAKGLHMSTIECSKCGKVNYVKYLQRWQCYDCGFNFINPCEGQIETWNKIKMAVKSRDNYTCQICGKTDGILVVHHIIPRDDGGKDALENLITVCNGVCHKKLEPLRMKFSITQETFLRIKNLAGNSGSNEEMIIRMCDELEKKRVKAR